MACWNTTNNFFIQAIFSAKILISSHTAKSLSLLLSLALTLRFSLCLLKIKRKDGMGKVVVFAYAVNYEGNLKETCNYSFSSYEKLLISSSVSRRAIWRLGRYSTSLRSVSRLTSVSASLHTRSTRNCNALLHYTGELTSAWTG